MSNKKVRKLFKILHSKHTKGIYKTESHMNQWQPWQSHFIKHAINFTLSSIPVSEPTSHYLTLSGKRMHLRRQSPLSIEAYRFICLWCMYILYCLWRYMYLMLQYMRTMYANVKTQINLAETLYIGPYVGKDDNELRTGTWL